MAPDPNRVHHMNGNYTASPTLSLSKTASLAVTDPNVQLQISTTQNDGSMSPVASPSPNSRTPTQFVAPSNKGRMMMNPQSPSSSFQHPGRPVSTQLQRQNSQQRMNQSPFSPQGTPQSPHDAFPGSPSSEIFARPQLDEQQFLHSPQTPKPPPQQQSPGHVPSGSNMNFGQLNQNQQEQPIIRPLDNMGGYVQAPGTPRPSFNPGQQRATVYARPGMFGKPAFGGNGPRGEQFAPQSPQDQNNRQLRDLLQRQQAPTNLPSPVPQTNLQSPTFPMENDQMKNQQNIALQQVQHQQQQLQLQPQLNQSKPLDNTFRQPLPPGMRQPRMQAMVGGQMIRSTQLVNPQRMIMNPNDNQNRPRMGIRPGTVVNQQMLPVQQQQMGMNQRMMLNQGGNFNQGDMMAQGGIIGDQNAMMTQRMVQSGQNVIMQQNLGQVNQQGQPGGDQNPNNQSNVPGDVEGIPDSVTAELEKLEQDENVGMDGVGDILGGLGDDDDDLLDSLTAEMGADFNILEYADPELDTTDDEKTNLLDSLELDESETKDEKLKEAEKLAKANAMNPAQQALQRQQMPMTNHQNVVNQIPASVNQIDQQGMNQAGPSQQGQLINQAGGQQVMLNPQGGINNFQRQQVRIKTIGANPIPEIQQIHQQMMLQVCNLSSFNRSCAKL